MAASPFRRAEMWRTHAGLLSPPCALYSGHLWPRLRNIAAQHEPAWLDQLEAEPLIERMGAVILLLGVEDDLPDAALLKIADGLSHQPRADTRTPRARMHRDAYQITG